MKKLIPVACLIAALGVMPAQANELHDAAEVGDKAVFKELLKKGTDIESVDENGATPLHVAAENKNAEIAEILIAKGAKVNAKDSYGSTPLFYAARSGSKQIVERLIAKGAKVSIANNEGHTPLYYAVKGDDSGETENVAIVRLLMDKGADVNAQQGTILWTAARYGELEIVKLLVSHKADVNTSHALHAATEGGSFEIVEFLLANGADATLKGNNGKTPLEIIDSPEMSVLQDQGKIVEILKAAEQRQKSE